MVTKQIHKLRKQGDITLMQEYDFMVQEKYLKYRKEKMHRYLRERLLKPTPDAFKEEGEFVTSASRSKEYHAVRPDGSLFYRVNKEMDSLPFPVQHFPSTTHDFSKWILESQGFVDVKAAKAAGLNNIISSGMKAHHDVQRFLMENGYAEAVEVPAWVSRGERDLLGITNKGERVYNERKYTTTCFIDALFFYRGKWWIFDYKPNAKSAANKHAVSQLLTCRDLLQFRTGVREIQCAYGDEKDTFLLVIPPGAQ